MSANKRMKTIAFSLLAGLLLPVLSGGTAAADENKTITLICRHDTTILSGMEWKLYKVGTRNGNTVSFVPQLAEFSMDLGDLSAEAIEESAKTIQSYTVAAKVPPLASGSTDENGDLAFTGLDNGLYLAVGKPLQVDISCYFPSTLLIELNDKDVSLDYDAFPKYDRTDLDGKAKRYIVKKVWVDDNDRALKRPVYVTVDLYKDGELEDTVTLSEENNWQHIWTTLSTDSEWLAVEREIPAQYEVLIDFNETQYLIRNSYINPPAETGTTAPAGTTVTTGTETAAPPAVTTAPDKLVQTGQLWWPVLPLSLGGVLLIGAGISMRAGKKKDEK